MYKYEILIYEAIQLWIEIVKEDGRSMPESKGKLSFD